MKLNLIRKSPLTILAMATVLMCSTLPSCKKNDPKPKKTQAEKVTEMLTGSGGTWSISGSAGITLDGVDVTTDLFTGFSITFFKNDFTTTGTTPVWLRHDTWAFKDENVEIFIRGQDDKEVTIVEISETQLKLSLEWDQTTYEEEGGRSKSLPGTYEFVLNK